MSIYVIKVKFLYFYALIVVRLDIVKQCLIEMQNESLVPELFLVKEVPRGKSSWQIEKHTKILILKEICSRCWELQGHVQQLSGLFLIAIINIYLSHAVYFIYNVVKSSILLGNFENSYLRILSFLLLINAPMASYFFVSQKLFKKGLRIAGLIHKIAQNNINDPLMVQAVTLMSLQLQQQSITEISILGLVSYDRTTLNWVSLVLKNSNFNKFQNGVEEI